MIRFLKDLFKKEEAAEEVSEEKLEEWFKSKSEGLISEAEEKIRQIRNKISEERSKAKQNLGVLEKAELRNPNITLRERQFMEGNRDAYVRRIGQFIDGVDADKPLGEIRDACLKIRNEINEIGRSTFKPYQILQHFFAHESREIAINIKEIENSINLIDKEIMNSHIEDLDEIGRLITSIKTSESRRQEFADEVKSKNESLKSILDLITKKESEAKQLAESSTYESYRENESKKENILGELRNHNDNLSQMFSVLERAMRKYSKITIGDYALLQQYLDDPVNAIILDHDLGIIDILEKVKKNIENGSIELDEKKREKSLSIIEGLNRDFLNEFINKSMDLNKQIDDIDRKLDTNRAKIEIDILKKETGNMKENCGRLKKEIDLLSSEIAKINIEDIKRQIVEKIGVLKLRVRII